MRLQNYIKRVIAIPIIPVKNKFFDKKELYKNEIRRIKLRNASL
jgi:hypothetical protein